MKHKEPKQKPQLFVYIIPVSSFYADKRLHFKRQPIRFAQFVAVRPAPHLAKLFCLFPCQIPFKHRFFFCFLVCCHHAISLFDYCDVKLFTCQINNFLSSSRRRLTAPARCVCAFLCAIVTSVTGCVL